MKNFFGLLVAVRPVALSCLTLSVVLTLASCAAEEPGLRWEQAWVRPMPPGAGMTAAYGILRNPGDESLKIISFSSPIFAEISLHETRIENGVSRMKAIPELVLAPGESFEMRPGAAHLMLMRPRQDTAGLQSLDVTVHLRCGDEMKNVAFAVGVGERG